MIPASQVVELFEGTGPGIGNDLHVGGYENEMDSGRAVYFPGGYGTVASLAESVREAGPVGFSLAGGGRSRKSRKAGKAGKARKTAKTRKARKSTNSKKTTKARKAKNSRHVHFSLKNQLIRFRK